MSESQLGVVLNARVVALNDGNAALLHVSGILQDDAEIAMFEIGAENTVWEQFETLIDELAFEVQAIDFSEDRDTGETNEEPPDIAEALELFLDSTVVEPDGTVLLVKQKIASVGPLQIFLYSNDHDPPHFHVKSTQRKIDARFYIDSLELWDVPHGKITSPEIKKIQAFFRTYPDKYAELKSEHLRMRGA